MTAHELAAKLFHLEYEGRLPPRSGGQRSPTGWDFEVRVKPPEAFVEAARRLVARVEELEEALKNLLEGPHSAREAAKAAYMNKLGPDSSIDAMRQQRGSCAALGVNVGTNGDFMATWLRLGPVETVEQQEGIA